MERLIPDVQPETRYIKCSDLPSIEELNCQRPSPAFVASVVAHQIHPIIVIDHPFNGYQLVAGNRRVYAAHLGGKESLRADVYQPGDISPTLVTVAENNQRKPNPLSDYDAIMPMLNSHTIEEVAAQLHLPVGVVRRAIKLQKLDSRLLQMARSGDIAMGTALKLASKPKSVQEAVLAKAAEGADVTADLVKRCTTTVVQAQMPTLPIRDLPGGNIGLWFERALTTAKGVKLLFHRDGQPEEFVLPVEKLYQIVAG